jgi:hypothetical protein
MFSLFAHHRVIIIVRTEKKNVFPPFFYFCLLLLLLLLLFWYCFDVSLSSLPASSTHTTIFFFFFLMLFGSIGRHTPTDIPFFDIFSVSCIACHESSGLAATEETQSFRSNRRERKEPSNVIIITAKEVRGRAMSWLICPANFSKINFLSLSSSSILFYSKGKIDKCQVYVYIYYKEWMMETLGYIYSLGSLAIIFMTFGWSIGAGLHNLIIR